VSFDGLVCRRAVLGVVGVSETGPRSEIARLDGLEPCVSNRETRGGMEVTHEGPDARQIVGTVGAEAGLFGLIGVGGDFIVGGAQADAPKAASFLLPPAYNDGFAVSVIDDDGVLRKNNGTAGIAHRAHAHERMCKCRHDVPTAREILRQVRYPVHRRGTG
jgi:hypothetical protein